MNFIRNKNLSDLIAIILLYMFVAAIPFNLLIFLGLLYIIEIGNGPHTSGFILVIGIPYMISFIVKPVILPVLSIIIYKKSCNHYIKYMFQTFMMPFLLLLCTIFWDGVYYLLFVYFNINDYVFFDPIFYFPVLSALSFYLPFYIVSFFCALKYKFFNNKINRQNR